MEEQAKVRSEEEDERRQKEASRNLEFVLFNQKRKQHTMNGGWGFILVKYIHARPYHVVLYTEKDKYVWLEKQK